MAGSSEYLPIATGGGANVDSQANFAGSTYQTQGFATGIAQPFQANKCWRQSSMVAAALTNVIANILSVAVPDDGNLANLIAWITTCFSCTTTRNGNGTFVQRSDGAGGLIYEAWGTVNSASAGGTLQTQAITFPAAFPGIPVLVLSLGTYPDGTSEDAMTAYHIGISTTGATAVLRAAVNIGGSGAGSLNAIPIHWHARY